MSETVALKEHLTKLLDSFKESTEQQFRGQDKAVQAALASAEKAVTAALTAAKEAVHEAKITQDQQLTSHNGLIRKMEIQTNTFIPRVEADLMIKNLDDKFAASIKPLNDYITAQQGQQKGIDKTWALAVTIIVVGIAILTFIGIKG